MSTPSEKPNKSRRWLERRRDLKRAFLMDAANLDRLADKISRSGEVALIPGVKADSEARAILLRAEATDLRTRLDKIVDGIVNEFFGDES